MWNLFNQSIHPVQAILPAIDSSLVEQKLMRELERIHYESSSSSDEEFTLSPLPLPPGDGLNIEAGISGASVEEPMRQGHDGVVDDLSADLNDLFSKPRQRRRWKERGR